MKKILISLACFWIGLMSVNSQKQVEVNVLEKFLISLKVE